MKKTYLLTNSEADLIREMLKATRLDSQFILARDAGKALSGITDEFYRFETKRRFSLHYGVNMIDCVHRAWEEAQGEVSPARVLVWNELVRKITRG